MQMCLHDSALPSYAHHHTAKFCPPLHGQLPLFASDSLVQRHVVYLVRGVLDQGPSQKGQVSLHECVYDLKIWFCNDTSE